jgi:hypothetical protein
VGFTACVSNLTNRQAARRRLTMKFDKSMTFSLSSYEIDMLNQLALHTTKKTPNDLVHQILQMGMMQMKFRTKYNARKTEERKIGRAFMNEFNGGSLSHDAMREIGIKMGLIVDNSDDEITSNE